MIGVQGSVRLAELSIGKGLGGPPGPAIPLTRGPKINATGKSRILWFGVTESREQTFQSARRCRPGPARILHEAGWARHAG